MKNIFSESALDFIKNKMKICDKDLTQKILSDASKSSKFFNQLFEYFIVIEIPYEYGNNFNDYKNATFINNTLFELFYQCHSKSNTKEFQIFDSIRHAFVSFKQGGILHMYQYREAEVWYPKVIIDSFLGIEKDIETLPNEITIYRGTSLDEYNSNSFGQSWSLKENIAYEFAFGYYKSSPKYINQDRVVLKAKIHKNYIFFYVNNGREEEVIIDSSKILSDMRWEEIIDLL